MLERVIRMPPKFVWSVRCWWAHSVSTLSNLETPLSSNRRPEPFSLHSLIGKPHTLIPQAWPKLVHQYGKCRHQASTRTHARTSPHPHTHTNVLRNPHALLWTSPCPSFNTPVPFSQHLRVLSTLPTAPLNTPNCTSQHSQLHLSTLQYLFLLLKSPVSFSEHHTVLSSHPSVLFTPQCPFLHTPPSFCSHHYILLVTPLCPSVHTPMSFCSHPSVLLFTSQCPFLHTPTSFCSHPYLLLFTPLSPSLHTPTSFSSHPSVLFFTPQCPSPPTSVSFSKYYRVCVSLSSSSSYW